MQYQQLNKDGCRFTVWAPEKETMTLTVLPATTIPMEKDASGYFHAHAPNAKAGDRYLLDNLPDPASLFQPLGVHGPSEIVDHTSYTWHDDQWRGLPLKDLIFYELHVGTFTKEGTFDAIIPHLDYLADLGINAIELMPVAQNPGTRNWGYDAVFIYAVQNNYGGPDGLKKFVDAAHRKGIAVFLDVIYNHIGHEGNILEKFGPYFSEKYHTPWGKALNFDDAWSDGVKHFVVNNTLYWAECYHIDGLRLDAIHEIFDRNATTIWDLLHEAVQNEKQRSGRNFYLIAESDLNSPKVVRPPETGGFGCDAQWMDDFHHSLYTLLDPDGRKNYKDFGSLEQLAKSYTEGFVHSNDYVSFRKRRHGASSAGLPGEKFVVFIQNHDIPGNRPGGERLSSLVDLPKLKLAAAAVLLSPYIPLIFMGEEYGEKAPFYFFSDYKDPEITSHLKESRLKQFAAFEWDKEPNDSQAEETFIRSKLNWKDRDNELLDWYKQLIALRRSITTNKKNFRADLIEDKAIALRYPTLLVLLNFSDKEIITHNMRLPPWGVITIS